MLLHRPLELVLEMKLTNVQELFVCRYGIGYECKSVQFVLNFIKSYSVLQKSMSTRYLRHNILFTYKESLSRPDDLLSSEILSNTISAVTILLSMHRNIRNDLGTISQIRIQLDCQTF